LQIAHYLVSFSRYVAVAYELTRVRIQGNLTRNINGIAGLNSLAIRPDWRWRIGGINDGGGHFGKVVGKEGIFKPKLTRKYAPADY
jgi:hypothetical protein